MDDALRGFRPNPTMDTHSAPCLEKQQSRLWIEGGFVVV